MKKLLAIALLGFSSVFAQTVQTTPNLITSGTTHTWSGVTTGTIGANYMPAGSTSAPRYEPATNSISFSYGQATFSQTIAINNALANVGAGVKINGYNYSYDTRNMNGDDRQGSIDTYTIITKMTSNTGATLLSTTQTYNTKFDWTTISGTQTASNPYELSGVGNLQFSATGKDSGFWAGYFGPQVRNVNMSLNYTVDPCAGNPRYSPTCPGYNTDMWMTGDLTSVYGTTFAVQQALGFGSTGVRVHSVNWGYDYAIGGQRCVWDILGLCMEWTNSTVGGSVSLNNSSNQQIVYDTNSTSGVNTSGSFRREVLVGSTSVNVSTLGNASISTWTNGNAVVSPYLGFTFTPDICATNPLVNSQCPGYAQAYFNQQCTANPLYDSQCPGYAQAYLTQQCSANPLYDPTCPGYATAYLNYQCSVNPLYSTTCAGYETAYFNQQCSINTLYSNRCPGYAQAYFNQQCSLNPLYDSQCPGYAQAYFNQQCSLNPLYNSGCPGYAQAYFNQQCTANQLYDRMCPGYSEAYAKKNILNVDTTSSKTTTTATATSTPTTDSTGNVSVAIVADPVVNSAVSTTATSASPAQAATATVPLVVTPTVTTTTTTTAAEEKKTESTTTASTSTSQSTSTDTKPAAPTARQELAARREAAARAAAVEKGKNLANDMGKAADMEAQKQVQNVVIAAMGYTPGFDAYGKTTIPDAAGYRPFTVYNNQANVDNRRLGRGLFGPTDVLHNELIDLQYNRGK